MDYVNDKKGEKGFEKEFEHYAPMFKCHYEKIKDPVITKHKYISMMKRKRLNQPIMPGEVQRAYDGIISTKLGNFPAEFKYNKGKLLPHQKKAQEAIDKINNSFFVVRKIAWYEGGKVCVDYTIEKRINQRMKRIYITSRFESLYRWFNGTIGDGNEHISHYIKWIKGA